MITSLWRGVAGLLRDHSNGSISVVMDLLERLLKAAEADQRQGSAIEILGLQALAYHARG
ncbi:MAG: hypothetical protein U0559_01910 [Anaerolineae bacterium]